MQNVNLNRVHFVGIGGIGMSGLAQHLLKKGVAVSGSDRQESAQTEKLRKLGARIFVPHDAKNIAEVCPTLVVRTSAVPPDNPEVAEALHRKISVLLREELLGQIFDGFETRIAVCGTHGKTTVTAMIHNMLTCCGVDHAAFIGGEYQGQNYFFGNSCVVAEACEYNRSFLNLHPTLCVCLNVEFDHPDCYRNQAEVKQAFETLFAQSKTVLLPRRYCGLHVENVQIDGDGCPNFDIFDGEHFVAPCRLRICGRHNIQNVLAALAAAKVLGLPLDVAAKSAETFCGVDRRWTELDCNGRRIVCDYAHHPTEIAAAVATARDVARGGKIFAVFQPHTYSRTKAFLSQFVRCFDGADTLVLLPVFAARETPNQGATSLDLFGLAKKQGKNVKYFDDFDHAAEFIKKNAAARDLILLVGAGDINTMAKLLK